MTVKQLIELLKSEDPDSIVLVEGYESGYDNINKVYQAIVEKNPTKDDPEIDNYWDGEYEVSETGLRVIIIKN